MLALKTDKGFSILEIVLGVAIFMVGMLGVAAMLISSIKGQAFSGNLTEASVLAANKMEELLGLPVGAAALADTDNDGTGQDLDDDDVDDNGDNFGLDHATQATADGMTANQGRNGIFTIYWNIAVTEPTVNSDTIKVLVNWTVKGNERSIGITGIKSRIN